jgi:hypothetical protein
MLKISLRKLQRRVQELEEENCNLQAALNQINSISDVAVEDDEPTHETRMANGLGSLFRRQDKSKSTAGRERRYTMSALGKYDEDDNVYPVRDFIATTKTAALMEFKRYLRETGREPRDYKLIAELV